MKKYKLIKQILKVNTFKTIVGYTYSLLERLVPINLSRNTINGIYNYLPIDQNISTSGQPTEAQFNAIKRADYVKVINLAPHDAENSLQNQVDILRKIDLSYQHIPVQFEKPREEDYEAFKLAMNDSKDQKIWVHCAANMRVSAFMYRYRCDQLNVSPDIARHDLEKIWEPFGVWAKFVNNR